MRKLTIITIYLLALFPFAAAIAGIELEERILLDKKVALRIPKGFEVMQEEILKVKYQQSVVLLWYTLTPQRELT